MPSFLGGAFLKELRGLFRGPELPLLGLLHVPRNAFAALVCAAPLLFLPRYLFTAVENATATPLKAPSAEGAALAAGQTILSIGASGAVAGGLRDENPPFDDYVLTDAGTPETPSLVRWLGLDLVAVRCDANRWSAADALSLDGGAVGFTVSPECKRDVDSGVRVDADQLTASVASGRPRGPWNGRSTGSEAVLTPPRGKGLASPSWFQEQFGRNLKVAFPWIRDGGLLHAPADVVLAGAPADRPFQEVRIRYDASDAAVLTPLSIDGGQADIEIRAPNTRDGLGKLTCQFPVGTTELEVAQLPATGLARLFVGRDLEWSSTWVTEVPGPAWLCEPQGSAPAPHADVHFTSSVERSLWSLTMPRDLVAPSWSVTEGDAGVSTVVCDDGTGFVPRGDLVRLRLSGIEGVHGSGNLRVAIAFKEGDWTSISSILGTRAWTCSPGPDAVDLHPLRETADAGAVRGTFNEARNVVTLQGPPTRICNARYVDPTSRLKTAEGCRSPPPTYVTVRSEYFRDCDVVNICPPFPPGL